MDKQADHKRVNSGSNIFRRLICRQVSGDALLDEIKAPSNTPTTSVRSSIDSLSGDAGFHYGGNGNALMSSAEYVRDTGSILSLQPWIFKRGDSWVNEGRINGTVEVSGSTRGQNSVRSRRAHSHPVKPLGLMNNSLIPRLHTDDFEMEEFAFSSLSSPTAAAARPFIVADGRKIINKSGYKHLAMPIESAWPNEVNGTRSRISEPVVGVSPLPEPRKPKRSRDMKHERINVDDSQRFSTQSYPQGSFDGRVLLSIGISIGVLFSALSNKNEIEKLNAKLKRTENLVQDLQEELEMKESLTVKELPHDTCGSREDIAGHEQSQLPKVESMSKIEAELEAELQRLEQNMNANNLEGRMSDLGEFIADIDVVHGDLRADSMDWKAHSSEGDYDRDSESTTTGRAHGANDSIYPLSPRQLSLRLHEVIQQRLEERVEELEAALARSQKQLQLIECERGFSNSDMGSPSDQLCLNLFGDALHAYDESYEEFPRLVDSDGNSPYTIKVNEKTHLKEPYCSDRSLMWGMENGTEMESTAGLEHVEAACARSRYQCSRSAESEEYDDDDEGKLLIRQIVERTRQGLPVAIHAQRMLFSVDD